MWRKGNPSALLVRMQTGAATVESSVEIPQKNKNEIALAWPVWLSWLEHHPHKLKGHRFDSQSGHMPGL